MQEKNTIRLNSLELEITERMDNGTISRIVVECGNYGVNMILRNAIQAFREANDGTNIDTVTERDEIMFKYDDIHDLTVGKDWITVMSGKRKWTMQSTFYTTNECVSEVEFMIHMMDLHPTVSD